MSKEKTKVAVEDQPRFKLSDEDKKAIYKIFSDRCKQAGININPKSKKFLDIQSDFFAGVMAAINECPPAWYVSVLRGEVIEGIPK